MHSRTGRPSLARDASSYCLVRQNDQASKFATLAEGDRLLRPLARNRSIFPFRVAEADEVRPLAKSAAQTPSAVASTGMAVTPAAPAAQALEAEERLSTLWPTIDPQPARDLLGFTPAAIPGYAVRALRRNPSVEREIVVEQEIANGVVVALFEQPVGQERQERRLDAAKARANERLARFVGGLRIEISGPLPMDSLSRLLDLVKP